MSKHSIQIEALDTLFFRDGKPFTAGEETTGGGIFPPMPSVLHGAIRTTYFGESTTTFKSSAQIKANTSGLTIESIWLAYDNENFVPFPRDLVVKKDWDAPNKKGKAKELTAHRLFLKKDESSNQSVQSLAVPDNDIQWEQPANLLIDQQSLQDYLDHTPESIFFEPLGNMMVVENKVGVGLDQSTRTAEEGRLYFLTFNRLQNSSGKRLKIGVTYNAPWQLKSAGLMRLGGEGKMARYSDTTSLTPKMPEIATKQFKLYLATPAFFSNGWLPFAVTTDNLNGVQIIDGKKYKFRILTAAVGKYIPIGGFDVAKNRPKPMLRAVPAGSVYYLEAESESDAQILANHWHGKSICDELSKEYNHANQGFGIAYVGKI